MSVDCNISKRSSQFICAVKVLRPKMTIADYGRRTEVQVAAYKHADVGRFVRSEYLSTDYLSPAQPKNPHPHTYNQPIPHPSPRSYHQHECNGSWYLYERRCVMQCPSGTYPAHDVHKSVCSLCHYTCTSCSGPSNTECTSCHGDASLDSSYDAAGEAQCIPKSLEWKTQSTKWFYRMTILFGLNLTFLTAAVVYLCLSAALRKRNARNPNAVHQSYNYNKLVAPTDEERIKEHQLLHRNGCLSDSD